jgi:hypothetical protein
MEEPRGQYLFSATKERREGIESIHIFRKDRKEMNDECFSHLLLFRIGKGMNQIISIHFKEFNVAM